MENEIKVEKMTLGEKIKKFFVKPSELFAQYKEAPKYGKLFLIIGIVSFIITIVGRLALGSISKEQLMQSTQNAEAAQLAVNLTNSPVFTAIIAIFAVIGVYIVIYIASFVYYLLVKLFKGNIKYNQMVSIYSLSYIAVLIGSVIQVLYSLIAKKPSADAAATATATDVLIKNLNLFGIWQMVLLVFGISEVSEISKKKAIIIVIIVWVLALGLGLLMLSLGNSLKSIAPTA